MAGNHNMYCSANQTDIVQILRDNADIDASEHVPDEVVQMQYDAANTIESLRQQLYSSQANVKKLREALMQVKHNYYRAALVQPIVNEALASL